MVVQDQERALPVPLPCVCVCVCVCVGDEQVSGADEGIARMVKLVCTHEAEELGREAVLAQQVWGQVPGCVYIVWWYIDQRPPQCPISETHLRRAASARTPRPRGARRAAGTACRTPAPPAWGRGSRRRRCCCQQPTGPAQHRPPLHSLPNRRPPPRTRPPVPPADWASRGQRPRPCVSQTAAS